jgi:hypothetical protein
MHGFPTVGQRYSLRVLFILLADHYLEGLLISSCFAPMQWLGKRCNLWGRFSETAQFRLKPAITGYELNQHAACTDAIYSEMIFVMTFGKMPTSTAKYYESFLSRIVVVYDRNSSVSCEVMSPAGPFDPPWCCECNIFPVACASCPKIAHIRSATMSKSALVRSRWAKLIIRPLRRIVKNKLQPGWVSIHKYTGIM